MERVFFIFILYVKILFFVLLLHFPQFFSFQLLLTQSNKSTAYSVKILML